MTIRRVEVTSPILWIANCDAAGCDKRREASSGERISDLVSHWFEARDLHACSPDCLEQLLRESRRRRADLARAVQDQDTRIAALEKAMATHEQSLREL